jgi:hypothetical protein
VTTKEPAVEPVEPPLLRIITPGATDEEVAALVAVVTALAAAGSAETAPSPRPEWSARHRTLRRTHRHGPGAWRASALP